MKSYGVTIQMTPLKQCFLMVLFVLYVVLTLGSVSVNEILWVNFFNSVLTLYYLMVLFSSVCTF